MDWIWHVIVTRSRLTSIIAKNGRNKNCEKEEDFLPIDTHAPNITLGWNLLILRLKPRQADDESAFLRQGTAILRGCPWVQSQVHGETVFPGAIDLNILEQYEQEHEGPEDPLLVCPNATTNYFVAGARVLLKWNIFQNAKQEPLTLVQKALRHLKENPSSLLDSEPFLNRNLKSMMDKMGILETRLWEARSVPPAQIKFHLTPQLYDDMAFISEIQHTTRQLFPEAKQVVSGPCLRNSRVRIERIFWVIDFSTHMEHRYVRLYDNQNSSSASPMKRKGQGSILPIGAEEYWGYGIKLINLPTDDGDSSADNIIMSRRKLKQLYRKSAQLLGTRPWSHFTPLEVLKVTLTIHGVGDVTKLIQFGANHENVTTQVDLSDDTTNPTPMGEVRIFHTKEALQMLGDNQWTDHSRHGKGINGQTTGSMALISEDLSFVHYDLILLMEHLFGPALLSPELPDGIIPLVKAQTSQTTEQPLSQNEMEWLQLCVLSIVDFVRDEHTFCEKNGRPIIRSYAVNKEGEPSAKGSDTVVTISYNQ